MHTLALAIAAHKYVSSTFVSTQVWVSLQISLCTVLLTHFLNCRLVTYGHHARSVHTRPRVISFNLFPSVLFIEVIVLSWEMPQRHSKNNNDLAFFTYDEKRKLGYGTQKERLGRDSIKPFDACCLCLKPVIDPMCCQKGHIFCKECILECLLAQKKDIQRSVSSQVYYSFLLLWILFPLWLWHG